MTCSESLTSGAFSLKALSTGCILYAISDSGRATVSEPRRPRPPLQLSSSSAEAMTLSIAGMSSLPACVSSILPPFFSNSLTDSSFSSCLT